MTNYMPNVNEDLGLEIQLKKDKYTISDGWDDELNYEYNIPVSIVDEISEKTDNLGNEEILASLFIILNNYESCIEYSNSEKYDENYKSEKSKVRRRISNYLNTHKDNLINNLSILINKYGYEKTLAHLKQTNVDNTNVLFQYLEKSEVLKTFEEENEHRYRYDREEETYVLADVPNDTIPYSILEYHKIRIKRLV